MLSLIKKIFIWWNQDTLGTKLKTLISGKFVGKDSFGNKYYQNKKDERWVIYNSEVEATNIPVEWYSWIHHMPNKIQKEHILKKYSWQKDHSPNLTGTTKAYHPNKEKDEPKKKYKTWIK